MSSKPQSTCAGVNLALIHELKQFRTVVVEVVFLCTLKGHLEAIIEEKPVQEAQKLAVRE